MIKIKPLWELSGKLANWLVRRSTMPKQTSFVSNKAIISILSTALIVGMSVFSVFAPTTRMTAFDGSDLANAQRYQTISLKANSFATNYYIMPLVVNFDNMVSAYKLDSDFTGMAVVDSNMQDVPYMPTNNGLYVFVNSIAQNATKNYRLYTANQDLHGDAVIMPSNQGLNVAGNSELNLGSNDFEIEVNGFFNPNNNDSNANVIFQNNQFALTYQGKQLKLQLGTSASESQIHTIQPATYLNGQKSVIIPATNATGNITIAYAPLNSQTTAYTSTRKSNEASVVNSTESVNPDDRTGIRSNGTRLTTYWTTLDTMTKQIQTISQNYTDTTTINIKVYNGTTLPVTINGNAQTINAGSTGVTSYTLDNKNPITIKAGGNNTSIVNTTTITNSNTSPTASKQTGMYYLTNTTYLSSDVVGSAYNYTTYFYQTVVNDYVVYTNSYVGNLIQTQITNSTNYTADALVGVDANGNIAYGYQYYWIDENSINCNWNGGDKRLIIKRVGNTISVLDGSTTLMSANIGNTAVQTNSVNSWTIAEQGAMRYLRSMSINNNGTEVASWEWNKGNTIADGSGHNHTATFVPYNGELTDNNFTATIGAEIPITTTTSDEPTTPPTSTTTEVPPSTETDVPPTTPTTTPPTKTSSGTTIPITTTTKTSAGLLDIDVPDLPQDVDESKWERIFLFGAFYNLAQEGGIPPSLFFVPLMAILTIIAFMVTYHFTRDMLISGIVGNAMLGVSITLSVFYTIPLIMGLILMVVLLVKRKTISL